jgi:hypothetical protein
MNMVEKWYDDGILCAKIELCRFPWFVTLYEVP